MTAETPLQKTIRLNAQKTYDCYLFRNNSGAFQDKTGRLIRFGLGNDSKAVNKALKSSDLVGFLPCRGLAVIIGVETKAPGWKWKGDAREVAQLHWLQLLNDNGGLGFFATSWEECNTRIANFLLAKGNIR